MVRTILSNEKYVGVSIVGRRLQRLSAPPISNPPEKWIRYEGAFQPIVSRELFDAAARVRRFNEKTFVTERDLIRALTIVFRREGLLTTEIIDQAPELPSSYTIWARFGTMTQAYERLGQVLRPRYEYHVVDRALKPFKKKAEESLLRFLEARANSCSVLGVLRIPCILGADNSFSRLL